MGLIATLRRKVESLEKRNEHLQEELRRFRKLAAFGHCGLSEMYCDDGELQDNTMLPFIDWKRDPSADILEKLDERRRRLHTQEKPCTTN